jgi:hypothetical protein
VGTIGSKRPSQRSRTVREDWSACLPAEMDQLFSATRTDLENSNVILSVVLDEALEFSEQEQFTVIQERAMAFKDLFDRLAIRLRRVIRTIEEHGSHFGTLPKVTALEAANFRGATAQRISSMDNFLAKILFGGRSRFFHKLQALGEIIEELQGETQSIVQGVCEGDLVFPDRVWRELEVLGYDLNTCMGETTVVLKSFFCVLPPEELEPFRMKLLMQIPDLLNVKP